MLAFIFEGCLYWIWTSLNIISECTFRKPKRNPENKRITNGSYIYLQHYKVKPTINQFIWVELHAVLAQCGLAM